MRHTTGEKPSYAQSVIPPADNGKARWTKNSMYIAEAGSTANRRNRPLLINVNQVEVPQINRDPAVNVGCTVVPPAAASANGKDRIGRLG
jgi:hypothetical protein